MNAEPSWNLIFIQVIIKKSDTFDQRKKRENSLKNKWIIFGFLKKQIVKYKWIFLFVSLVH